MTAGSLAPGASLTVGVRPEHLTMRGSREFSVTGPIELVERLGEASYALVRCADDKLLVAEIRGRDTPSSGQTVTFSAPAEDIHVFDETGCRV